MTIVRDPKSPGAGQHGQQIHENCDHAMDAMRYACIDFGTPHPRPWYVRLWHWIQNIPMRLISSFVNWRFGKFHQTNARPFGKMHKYQMQVFAYMQEAERNGHKVYFVPPVRLRPTPKSSEDWFFQEFMKSHEKHDWKPFYFDAEGVDGVLETLKKYKYKQEKKAEKHTLHINEWAYLPPKQ